MRVLSLGAGVQSSTLLLMACEGELEIDAAVFADTQWEPAAVYEWLDVLEFAAKKARIPFHRVTAGNLRADALDPTRKFAAMPLYIERDGERLMGQRQCTNQYKVKPVQQLVRSWGATAKNPVELVMGISLDEWRRMADARVRYVRHVYPLVTDLKMTRGDCLQWLMRHGYPRPVKSSCVGCPFRTPAGWRSLTPEELNDAIDFDRSIRHGANGTQYLHRDFIPLALADLRSEQDRGQLDLFNESDGCGVVCPSEEAA